MKAASKLALADSHARRRVYLNMTNPGNTAIIKIHKEEKRLHEHRMKTDVEYAKKINMPPKK